MSSDIVDSMAVRWNKTVLLLFLFQFYFNCAQLWLSLWLPGRRHSTGRMRCPSSDVPFSL